MVELTQEAELNGLAVMLADLIRKNIEKNQWKEKDLKSITTRVGINAIDADVKVTLDFKGDKLIIHHGEFSPDIVISGPMSALLELSKIKIITPFHIPIITRENFDLVKSLLKRNLKIDIKVREPKKILSIFFDTFRLLKVFSIYP